MASWLGTLAASGPWTVNQWSNSQVRITAGTGAGQVRTIASNTATAQTNANIVTAASLKGLADLLISLVQLDIVQARETRRLARQVLRLSRVQTGVPTSADVGTDAT